VSGEPSPKAAGQSESFAVSNLANNTTYYFALKTTDDSGNTSPLSNSPNAETLQNPSITGCVTPSCHGNQSLAKTITIPNKPDETVPLYVDLAAYEASTHGSVGCTTCHTDIVVQGGVHGGVGKSYGGWARYSASQSVDLGGTIPAGEEDTRNYYTAASMACAQSGCHTTHSGFASTAHRTIFKLRASSVRSVAGHAVGEDYVVGNCNRCHSSCATCHFESTISRKDTSADDIANHWAEIQSNGDGGVSNASALTEWAMDWTTNVRDHNFRSGASFGSSSEVCRSCHIGYVKPPAWGFYETTGGADSLKATGVRRHPQYQELNRGNSAHNDKQCASCHDNVHSYPGTDYVWAQGGDVQCVDCHTAQQSGHYANHENVACIGCHTGGLARDVGQTDGHNVWIDPVTNQVRPVVVKYSEPITWYTHTWNTGEGACGTRCHYTGNRVGAPPFAGVVSYVPTPSQGAWLGLSVLRPSRSSEE
jgi:hypothetical protein